jgi:hypothetical protein
MKKIAILEKVINKEIHYSEVEVNGTFFNAYRETQYDGLKELNFNNVIWEEDIEEIVANCKKFNVKHFTISNTSSGFIRRLALFKKAGCDFAGLSTIKYDFLGEVDVIRMKVK